MAKVWLIRGKTKLFRRGPEAERSLQYCIKELGLASRDWISSVGIPPNLLSDPAKSGGAMAAETIIIELEAPDLIGFQGWKAGFYMPPVAAEDLKRKLKKTSPGAADHIVGCRTKSLFL